MASRLAPPLEGPKGISPKGAAVIVVTVIFFTLSCLFVGLRLWARMIKRVALMVNDYMIIAALIFQAGETAVLIVGTVLGGLGYHSSTLSSKQVNHLLKTYMAAEPLWISSNSCAKVSLLHLYVKIFSAKPFRIAVCTVMGIVAACWLSTVIRMCFLCTPFAYVWNRSIKGGTCINLRAAWLSVSVINMILDIIIMIMPIPLLWQLRIPVGKKVALSGIFSLGFVICVVTILRIVAVTQLDTTDFSYSVVNDAIWSAVEPCLSIINACLPVLQPVLSKILGPKSCSSTRGPVNDSTRATSWSLPRTHERTGTRTTVEVKNKGFHRLTPDDGIYPLVTSTCSVRPKNSGDLESQGFDQAQMQGMGGIRVTHDWDVRTLKDEPISPGR